MSENLKKAVFYSLLFVAAIVISSLVTLIGPEIGVLIIIVSFLIPIIIMSITNVYFGFKVLVIYSFFLFIIGRMSPYKIPTGVGVEIILIVLLLGFILDNKKINWLNFKNPVTYIVLVSTAYGFLQVLNPSAVTILAWLTWSRVLIFNLVLYFVCVNMFQNLKTVIQFTKLWLVLAIFGGLYGIYQQIFGYTDFEWNMILNTPGLLSLIKTGAVIRKFSFFSDVTTFGIFMSFSTIFSIILSFGPISISKKALLLTGSVILILGMAYSGTRTATVMIPIGLAMYGFLNLNKRNTLILGFLVMIVFMIFYYGPFYGKTATRVRSAFLFKSDASLNVRDINRKRIQPYMYSHPIGGGVLTSGEFSEFNAGHPLAGFPPDSGYLQTAIEIGWIGLIIELLLYFHVLRIGIKNYYSCKSGMIKILYAAYICSFFALTLANLTQASTMTQKPTNILVYSIFAILPNMINFNKKNELGGDFRAQSKANI